MRPDGSERHAAHEAERASFTPAWSPDSSRIVFSTNAKSGEVYELFTIGVDGKGLRSVVPTAGDNFEPAWSPDGSKIAYQEAGAIFTVELGRRRRREAHRQREQRLVAGLEPEAAVRRRASAQNVPKRSYASSGRHAVADGRADLALGRGLLLGFGEHVLGDRRGHDDHAVVVADDPVARLDPHVADRHGHLRRLELPAPRRVLGRDEARRRRGSPPRG